MAAQQLHLLEQSAIAQHVENSRRSWWSQLNDDVDKKIVAHIKVQYRNQMMASHHRIYSLLLGVDQDRIGDVQGLLCIKDLKMRVSHCYNKQYNYHDFQTSNMDPFLTPLFFKFLGRVLTLSEAPCELTYASLTKESLKNINNEAVNVAQWLVELWIFHILEAVRAPNIRVMVSKLKKESFLGLYDSLPDSAKIAILKDILLMAKKAREQRKKYIKNIINVVFIRGGFLQGSDTIKNEFKKDCYIDNWVFIYSYFRDAVQLKKENKQVMEFYRDLLMRPCFTEDMIKKMEPVPAGLLSCFIMVGVDFSQILNKYYPVAKGAMPKGILKAYLDLSNKAYLKAEDGRGNGASAYSQENAVAEFCQKLIALVFGSCNDREYSVDSSTLGSHGIALLKNLVACDVVARNKVLAIVAYELMIQKQVTVAVELLKDSNVRGPVKPALEEMLIPICDYVAPEKCSLDRMSKEDLEGNKAYILINTIITWLRARSNNKEDSALLF